MHDKRDDKKRGCYHGGPRSRITFPYDLSADHQSVYMTFCELGWHLGAIASGNKKLCERRKCRHYSRYRPDKDSYELEKCKSRKNRNEKRGEPRIISAPLQKDKDGQFIAYCSNPDLSGIIYLNKCGKCEYESCPDYNKFRPPSSHRRKC